MNPEERAIFDEVKSMRPDFAALVDYMLKGGLDYINQGAAGRLARTFWPRLKTTDARQKQFDRMIELGMVKVVGKHAQVFAVLRR